MCDQLKKVTKTVRAILHHHSLLMVGYTAHVIDFSPSTGIDYRYRPTFRNGDMVVS